ncbi:MAG: hypothetical protein QOH27_3284 [Mycobacterium sp.]|jgi:hypothetical protein|nr:hypothetical protein [Mycobacterium sp.]
MLAFLVVGVFVVFVGAAVWFGRGHRCQSDYWDSGSDSGSGSVGAHVDGGCGGGGCGGGGGD